MSASARPAAEPAPEPGAEPAGQPAPRREVAVTFDDLPVISVTRGDVASHRAITERLLQAVAAHGVPAVGFVNEKKLARDGIAEPARVDLLRAWLDAGHELGNHTFAHLDLHAVPVERYEEDIRAGEPVLRGLLAARGQPLRWFRHPFLRTGTSLPVKHRVEAFLAGRGYTIAPVTVYTEDYQFAAAYDRAAEAGDTRAMRAVAAAYLPYVERQFEFYEALSRRLMGHEIPQVLLLHANSINAERFDALATMLERRGYRFVTLERALADPAYARAESYAGIEGLSWLVRWALSEGHDPALLDGEPEVPRFVRARSEPGWSGRLRGLWRRARTLAG